MDKINIKKIAVIGLATAVLFVGLAMATPVKKAAAETVEELQAQIQALLQQIAQLQNQLAALQGETPSGTSTSDYCYNFTRNLTIGSTGDDVKALQRILISEGVWTTPSVGATGYFGPITKNSLAAFQDKHAAEILIPLGLTKGTGYFGPSTRNYIASQCGVAPSPSPSPSPGASPSPSPSPTAEGLTVEVAADNPAAATIPDGSLYNPMLKINLTAGSSDVTVDSITVTRGGIIANTNVTGVSIWDEEGNRLGNIVESLTDDGKATIDLGEDEITIPAGQTKAVIVKANISGSAGSGTINFSINSASDISTEEDVTINGSFPIVGNTMGVVDGSSSLGDVYVDDQSVSGLAWSTISSATGNVEVGDQDKEVFKVKFTQNNSKEAIQLEQLTVYVEGTIEESSDVTNWRLYAPDGTLLASADKPVDRFVTFKLDTPYVIDKGLSKTLSVKVDITDGSQHYFRVSIQNDYDILVRGVTTGSYVEPLDSSGSSFDSADTQNTNGGFKIKQGALTVSRASDCPSGNVAPGATDIVLAKFDLKSSGEKLQVRKMGIQIQYASTLLTGTVKVRDAETGTTYLSLSASTSNLQTTSTPDADSLLTYRRNLSSYLTIPSGETKTIEIVGSVSSSAGSSDSYTVYVGQFYCKRYSTNDYTTLAEGAYHGNTLGVTDVALTVTKNNAFANTNRAIGATEVKIGEYVFQASSADDIKINSISLTVTGTDTNDDDDGYGHLAIQNMKLKDEDGNQLGSTIGTPSASGNSFSVDLTISKSESKVISVYADILSSADADDTVQTKVEASGVSGYGVSSSKDLSSTPSSAVSGQIMTFKTGTVTIKKDANAPSTQIIVADSSGVELNKISFEAKNEDLTLKKITLQLVSASTSQWTVDEVAQNIARVYLYDGSDLLNAGGTPVGSNGKVIISGLNVTLPQDQTKVLTVKADISPSGTLTSKSVGGIKVYSTSTDDLEIYSAQGVMDSGITLTSNAQSNYFLFTDSAVEVADAYSGETTKTPSSNDEIARFTITNNGSRTITLTNIVMKASVSGLDNSNSSAVTTFKLYDDAGVTIDSSVTLYSNAGCTTSVSALSYTTSTVYAKFIPDTTQEIAAGSSKTYVVKADTSGIRTGLSSGSYAYLSTEIGGEKGYDSSNSTSELFWKDSYITYSYTPAGSSTAVTGLNASDSVPVNGPTIQY